MGKIYLNEEEFGSSSGAVLEEYDYAYLNGYSFELPMALDWDHKVEVTFKGDAYSNLMAIAGNNDSNIAYARFNVIYYNNTIYGISTVLTTTDFTGKHTYIYNDNARDYFDGTDVGASRFEPPAPSSSCKYQIGYSKNGSSSNLYKGRIYNFKITSNTTGEVLLDLIPARLVVCGAVLKAGLFERISGAFYENAKITLGND